MTAHAASPVSVLPLCVLAAVCVVAGPIAVGLLADACPHADDEHERISAAFDEMQQITRGELERGRRMEWMAREIRAHEGFWMALQAERGR